MTFLAYLRSALRAVVLTALATAILCSIFLALGGAISGDVTLDISLSGFEGLWLFLVLPLSLSVLTLLVSPLAFGIYQLYTLLRRAILRGVKPVEERKS